jgi:hypothetical protein
VKTVRSSASEETTDATATRDLSAMAKAGLLEPIGEKRGRYYQPTAQLTQVWRAIREGRQRQPTDNPYEVVQPQLPGLGA